MSRTSARMLSPEPLRVAPTEPRLTIYPPSGLDREQRIIRALGKSKRSIPHVDEATLSSYYRYLSAHLPLPLAAHYPMPTSPSEEAEFQCIVLALLDPSKHLGDAMDGIVCKTRKGRYEVNLPLLDLYLPEEDRAFQLIEDYWYWFWNWR